MLCLNMNLHHAHSICHVRESRAKCLEWFSEIRIQSHSQVTMTTKYVYVQYIYTHMLLSEVMSYTKLTSLCEYGPRDPTNNLTTMVPKDQMSVLRETHSGRTSLQDMWKDVWDWGRSNSAGVWYSIPHFNVYLVLPNTCLFDRYMHDTGPWNQVYLQASCIHQHRYM